MGSINFSHNGKEYKVSAITEFQQSMVGNLFIDLGNELGDEWDKLPATQSKLVGYFIRWNISTVIDNKPFNFITDVTPDNLESFSLLVASDNELASKWSNAYKSANLEQTDPNVQSEEPPQE